MKPWIAAFSLALALTGCEATMNADVTQFSTQGGVPMGRSFVVAPDPAQSANLEFHYYAGLVGAALQSHGLRAATSDRDADMVVAIHYGGMGSHTEIYGDPLWGTYGWGHRRVPPPWNNDIESRTYYGQMLEVQIFEAPAWRANLHNMIYQGRAVGDVAVNDVRSAIPSLVDALFAHFPGNNGQMERISVPLKAAPAPVQVPVPMMSGQKTAI
jgi:hypothetical protein